jgi:ADP-heptose:LPS heptosyltransferase
VPDPAAKSHWGKVLASLSDGRPIVGITWRSTRQKKDSVGLTYPNLQSIAEILKAHDVLWINLQYDDPNQQEANTLRKMSGARLHTLDGLDLKDDIDGLAAAMSEMDLVIGPANAPVVLAAAIGKPTVSLWTRSLRISWRTHNQPEATPWFRNMRIIERRPHEAWDAVVVRANAALDDQFKHLR